MFTGLVERVGKISSLQNTGQACAFTIEVEDESYLADVQLGESISVAGVCLTVVEYSSRSFAVQAVEETLRRSSLGKLNVGDNVNLERALKADARLGGHIVQGHIDGVGNIVAIRDEGHSWWVTIEPPFELMKFIVTKGSICLDGISLTVANVAYSRFSVAIIPHTMSVTTANKWSVGTLLNIETDIIARHVERLMQWQAGIDN